MGRGFNRPSHLVAALAMSAASFTAAPRPAAAWSIASTTTTGMPGPLHGGVAATITVAVRSVTVIRGSLTFGGCVDATGQPAGQEMPLPNGRCSAGPLTVINGAASSHLLVSATNATPVGQASVWRLCDPGRTHDRCSGPAGNPGTDEFSEATLGSGRPPTQLVATLGCDFAFGSSVDPCAAAPFATRTEYLSVEGPWASTSPTMSSYVNAVLWTAAP